MCNTCVCIFMNRNKHSWRDLVSNSCKVLQIQTSTYQPLCWNYIFRLQDTVNKTTAVISNGNWIYDDSRFLRKRNKHFL